MVETIDIPKGFLVVLEVAWTPKNAEITKVLILTVKYKNLVISRYFA